MDCYMPVRFCLHFVIFAVILFKEGAYCKNVKSISTSEWPSLYVFDDYDSCLKPNKNGSSSAAQSSSLLSSTYCMVYAEIQADNSSELWQHLYEYSNGHKFNYHRDQLFMGVCLQRCKHFIGMEELNATKPIRNEITQYFGRVHKRQIDQRLRRKYHKMINLCLNSAFERQYNLSLRTYVEYCERPQTGQTRVKMDILENIFYKIIASLITFNILSTIYDFCLKEQQPAKYRTNDFYKINPEQTVSRLMTSFSIRRNFYRLIQPYNSDIGRDFCFLHGFRAVTAILVLFGHTFFIEFQHVKNPEFSENVGHNPKQLWLYNSTIIIEIFFVMSGLMLNIKFQFGKFVCPSTTWKKCIKTYLHILLFRYIRFFPSLVLLLLFNATNATRWLDGPFWRHTTEPSRVFSREKWWQNLFMINNFSHKESSNHHTWYMAADYQLFALYLFILVIIAKYPKFKKHILTAMAVLAFVVPTLISYLKKLDSSFMIVPECYRYTYFKDISVYYEIYMRPYTNLGGYLFGIICGDLYLMYTSKEAIKNKVKGALLYELGSYIAVPAAAGILYLGSIMIFQQASIWTALYSGMHRNMWVLIVCGLPLLGMSCGGGYLAYEFCCLPIFRVLSRLSFQAYLWHVIVLYYIHGYQRQPVYVNWFYYISKFLLLLLLTNLVAFVMALMVEYPVAQIVKFIQPKGNIPKIKASSNYKNKLI